MLNWRQRGLKVALVHDWLVGARGGEQVLAELCGLFPQADIYTLRYEPGSVGPPIEQHTIIQSPLIRPLGKKFRLALPLFFHAIRQFDLSAYDLVISSSHCVAHAVRLFASQLHIAYIHTPMRYLYDQMHTYLPQRGQGISWPLARLATAPLRRWDEKAAQRTDVIVANSQFVADRIARVWGRESSVIYPPVALSDDGVPPAPLSPTPQSLLFVGALVPYKRADLAVALAVETGRPLTVVGTGPQESELRKKAPKHIRFLGRVSKETLTQLFVTHETLVFAAEEDFGMAPVEAIAQGCPVLGVDYGGLRETVCLLQGQRCGALAASPDLRALKVALKEIDTGRRQKAFDREKMRQWAAQFGAVQFRRRFASLLDRACRGDG